ncbi:MAG: antitoxin family protein [Blastocatellia bacterium]
MMNSETLKAVYRDGTLVLDKPLPMANGDEVEVVVIGNDRDKSGGRRVAERLAEIAALPLEGETEPFSGRDHDRILYGKANEK